LFQARSPAQENQSVARETGSGFGFGGKKMIAIEKQYVGLDLLAHSATVVCATEIRGRKSKGSIVRGFEGTTPRVP